jgi:phage gpG-like protein
MITDPLQLPLMQLARMVVGLKPVLIDAIGTEALHFIDDNFRLQAWQGATTVPWPKRRSKDKGAARALLVQTGTLRRSINKTDSADHTTIHTDVPYARIHNEGGDVRHPYRTVILSYKGKPGALKLAKTNTESQQRRVTTIRRSSIYNHVTKMPQRQFIGDSPILTQRCEHAIIQILKAHLPN